MIVQKRSMIGGIVCAILLLTLNTWAEQMRFLICEEPPMNSKKDNKITGFTTDIVRELQDLTGIGGKIELLPWKRVHRTGLEEPNVILYTAARTAEREQLFHWVGPAVPKRWILFSKKRSGIKPVNLDAAGNAGKIAVMRNDARERFLRNHGIENLFQHVSENRGGFG